jgi:hypothetical protein
MVTYAHSPDFDVIDDDHAQERGRTAGTGSPPTPTAPTSSSSLTDTGARSTRDTGTEP